MTTSTTDGRRLDDHDPHGVRELPGPDPWAPVRSAGTVLRCRPSVIALAAGLGLVVASTVGQLSTLDGGTGPLAGFTPDQQAHQILGGAFLLGLFAAATTAMSVVRSIGSGLYGAAVLRYPRRWPVVIIQAVEAAVVGLVFAVVALVAVTLTAMLAGRVLGVELPLIQALPRVTAGVLPAVVAQAVVGSAVGWLIRRSAPAVLVLVGVIAIGEPGLMAAWPAATPYLLSGGAAGLMDDLSLAGRTSALPALGVEVLWVLVTVGAAALLTARRDVPTNATEDRS